ncbi:hypothetical protein AWRI1631_50060 [Saccharomyces cerevisiae AWRI1631]|uniref:Uncharacterized protein n=1 Tax=Saccharomyces cerevisiae (strain AWRI1631) TaxID=545124 RepID=B5VH71_YEAS6|nr:hypothetical protein AWRI1631_50060 [Saccharomyces cerevisiae AWRI1631]
MYSGNTTTQPITSGTIICAVFHSSFKPPAKVNGTNTHPKNTVINNIPMISNFQNAMSIQKDFHFNLFSASNSGFNLSLACFLAKYLMCNIQIPSGIQASGSIKAHIPIPHFQLAPMALVTFPLIQVLMINGKAGMNKANNLQFKLEKSEAITSKIRIIPVRPSW